MSIDRETVEQNPKPPTRAGMVLGQIVSAVVVIILALVLIVGIWNGVDRATDYSAPILGYRFAVIVSDSMSTVNPANEKELKGVDDQFDKNDVVIAKTKVSYEDLNINDILLVDYGGTLICHRLVEMHISDDGVPMVVTRGDANSAIDTPMPFDNVKGVIIRIVPKVGTVILFLQSAYGMLAVCLVIFFIVLGMFLAEWYNSNHRYRPYEVSKEPSEVLSVSPLTVEMGKHPERRKDVDDTEI